MNASTLRRLAPGHLATVTALLIGAVPPAAAADFQIDNLRLDFGALAIVAPRIDVKGSALEREAFIALFNGSTGESAAARMSRLDAAEITAPELTFEQTIGPQKQVTRYRDIRFSQVRAGRIERGEAAQGTISVTGGAAGPVSGQVKRTSFEGLDLKHTARVLTERAQPGVNEPLLPIFSRFELDGYAVDLGPAGKMSMGRMVGRGFSAKVGDEPLGEVLARIVTLSEAAEKASRESAGAPDKPKSKEEKQLGLSLLSLYDTIFYGSGEARDFAMNVVAPPKPGAKPDPVEMTIARIAYGEDTPAKSGMALEGLKFAGGGGKGTIESISHSGFSFGPVIAELKALLAKPDADPDTIDFRKFVPTIGTIRLTGLSVEAPQETVRGQPAPPPLKIGLGTFELKTGEQLNGIPTSLAMTIDRLMAPVTEGPGNPAARDLIAMGFRSIDLSAKLDMAWDAARSELAIRTLSLGGAGMARLDASGTLGNVTKDLFSSDLALAQVAALGATVRNVEAKLQNLGLLEKIVENEARKAKRKPEDLRREYSMMANLGLAAILGPSDAAKTLTAAVSRFAAKPGTLTVSASAKSASGLGLADVITLTDPTEIFDKIDLKANAE
ncbi:hypothetical protein [Bosea sp. PAMC 26642]|uniref:hypothetical protein n=1 Tax=Bosea sp. (strain PAMC 26642) TaxID=1792307 RepID=UPI0007701EED|nr:hypothetical protein [Bosea sp. PAMC 26642]AMJ59872.1 hypothetical protein AXW83_05765 [Bosea sp. PAMC 26642]